MNLWIRWCALPSSTHRTLMSKYTLITKWFNIKVHKFQQWERPHWAKLETQLWLLCLVRFIKIYETANIWISGVLVFFQHLESQPDRLCAWICSWRCRTYTFPESHPIFCKKKDFDVNLGFTSPAFHRLQSISLLFVSGIWPEPKVGHQIYNKVFLNNKLH